MRKTETFVLAVLLLCVAASPALGRWAWFWTLPLKLPQMATDTTGVYFYLTKNSGSHAVAMTEYDNNSKVWTSILTERLDSAWAPAGNVRAFEYSDVQPDWRHWTQSGVWPFCPPSPDTDDNKRAVNCNVTCNALHRIFSWGNVHPGDTSDHPDGQGCGDSLTKQDGNFWIPTFRFNNIQSDSLLDDSGVAVALFQGPSGSEGRGCAVFIRADYSQSYFPCLCAYTTQDGGEYWDQNVPITIKYADPEFVRFTHPSLATDDINGSNVYLAYDSTDLDGISFHVVYRKSTNWGAGWPSESVKVIADHGSSPCIAAVGHFVLVCWKTTGTDPRIWYSYSTDGSCAGSWSEPAPVPFYAQPGWKLLRPNVAAVPCTDGSHPGFLIVAQVEIPEGVDASARTTRGWFLRFNDGGVDYSQGLLPLCSPFSRAGSAQPNPSIAAIHRDNVALPGNPIACCVVSTPPYRTSAPLTAGISVRTRDIGRIVVPDFHRA